MTPEVWGSTLQAAQPSCLASSWSAGRPHRTMGCLLAPEENSLTPNTRGRGFPLLLGDGVGDGERPRRSVVARPRSGHAAAGDSRTKGNNETRPFAVAMKQISVGAVSVASAPSAGRWALPRVLC